MKKQSCFRSLRNILIQSILIVSLSTLAALTYNLFSTPPLPIFNKYQAQLNGSNTNPAKTNSAVPFFDEVDYEFLKQLMESGDVLLFDARTKEEFNAGHIPGAKNLEVLDFYEGFSRFSTIFSGDKIIVCYCSSKYCEDSFKLATLLFHQEVDNIFIFRGGYEEWVEKSVSIKE